MGTFEQEKEQRDKLLSLLERLNQIQPESLIRRNELGETFHFASGLPYFERTLRLFRSLSESSLDNIPFKVLDKLARLAQDADSEFQQIRSFNPTMANAVPERDRLITQVRDKYDTYYTEITPIIAYAIRKGTDFELLENNARKIVAELEQIRDEMRSFSDEVRNEVKSALQQVRQAAAESGVAQHSIIFGDEAQLHDQLSAKWLKAAIWLSVSLMLLTLLSVGYYAFYAVDYGVGHSIQLAVAKIIAFSVLYFALVSAVRIYRAHRHNFVINKHRQNALSTFRAFVEAAKSDEATKNAVLLRATEAIFGPEITGYVHGEKDTPGTPQVLEIIKGVLPKQS